MDINIIFKLPPVFDYNCERHIFNSFLDRLLSFGVDCSKSDFYNTFDNGKEVFICSFYFRDLSFVQKSIFNNEQLEQLQSIESDIFKRQGLYYPSHLVGRKNKFSKAQVDLILESDKSYRCLAKEFNCSLGLIAKIKKGGYKYG